MARHSLPRLVPKQVITDFVNEFIRKLDDPLYPVPKEILRGSLITLREVAIRMRWTPLVYRINHVLFDKTNLGGNNVKGTADTSVTDCKT